MKSGLHKGVSRKKRLEKGYITRLKKIVKNKGFGAIEYIAGEAKVSRDALSSTLKDGKANKTNKAKIEAFVDREAPIRKPIKQVEDVAA